MTAVASIDSTTTLEAKEKYGTYIYLVRRMRVINLVDTDYQVLQSALTAAGVPVNGSFLVGTTAANLVLTERNVKLVEEDKGSVDVDCVYEPALNEGQNIDAPFYGLLVGEVQASLNEVESNVDGAGVPITVQYTYPTTDTEQPGKTVVQGGVIKFFQAQKTQTFEGIKSINTPWLLAAHLVGGVNRSPWLGGTVAQWMCTKCSWRIWDNNPAVITGRNIIRFKFSFEFQFNPDTWDPTVVFIDSKTGLPPANLVAGQGYKRIQKHDRVDFEQALGSKLQGG